MLHSCVHWPDSLIYTDNVVINFPNLKKRVFLKVLHAYMFLLKVDLKFCLQEWPHGKHNLSFLTNSWETGALCQHRGINTAMPF